MSFESAVASDFNAVVTFVEKAAPTVESTIVADFNNAVSAAKSAFTPVADAAVVAAVDLITSKFALNSPFSATEIAFLEGIIAKLQALLPSA